jgi:aminopeptidase YwaD
MVDETPLLLKTQQFINRLCLDIPNRRVGSAGNRAAADLLEAELAASGFETERQWFDCLDWVAGKATLEVGGQHFQVLPGPYTIGCDVAGELVVATSLAELEGAELQGRLLLARGELTAEQLMPKNFPFYNPEEHQYIYDLLEEKKPLAALAATARNPELAGAVYPFPWIEDGDFDLPNAYLTDELGDRLAGCHGKNARLTIDARRIPAQGCNVVGRIGETDGRRIVLTAHLDAKEGTPGALDNASGVVTLLLLAELLSGYVGSPGVELVFFNGEDHYSAAGEIEYLARNQGLLDHIVLNINLDGVGYVHGRTAYSVYECSMDLEQRIAWAFATHSGLVVGGAWYQGDHMVFVQNGVPALAITTAEFELISRQFTHTEHDRPELVDPQRLAGLALALKDLIKILD